MFFDRVSISSFERLAQSIILFISIILSESFFNLKDSIKSFVEITLYSFSKFQTSIKFLNELKKYTIFQNSLYQSSDFSKLIL